MSEKNGLLRLEDCWGMRHRLGADERQTRRSYARTTRLPDPSTPHPPKPIKIGNVDCSRQASISAVHQLRRVDSGHPALDERTAERACTSKGSSFKRTGVTFPNVTSSRRDLLKDIPCAKTTTQLSINTKLCTHREACKPCADTFSTDGNPV